MVILANLARSGSAALKEIAGWFDCPTMETMLTLGRMVAADIVYRSGWDDKGNSLWSLMPDA